MAKVKSFLDTKIIVFFTRYTLLCYFSPATVVWNSFWGSTFKTYLKKLGTLQNKAVKIIGEGRYSDRTTPYYSKFRILKINNLVKFEKALFVFKFKQKSLSIQFNNFMVQVSKIYEKSTRVTCQENYFIPFLRTPKLQRSIKCQSPLIWNSLGSELKQI